MGIMLVFHNQTEVVKYHFILYYLQLFKENILQSLFFDKNNDIYTFIHIFIDMVWNKIQQYGKKKDNSGN